MTGKLKNLSALARIVGNIKKRGQKVVFTNGCFDILHAGHVEYLSKARKMGDILVIGLNSDSSVKKLKGDNRPINNELDRARVLSALYFIDYVTIFNEKTPESLIKKLKPDYLVKGGDWNEEKIAGADFVKSYGGKVRIVPFVAGYSTSSVIDKIAKRP